MNDSRKPSKLEIRAYLSDKNEQVNQFLDRLLPVEKTYPYRLNQAMRYSVFAGGKRLRPILAIATGEALQGEAYSIMVLACALEMIHTYTLIHDDLPAMDDDDLRRGRPSCHKKFGEGMAILAGNGLMNLAFQILVEKLSGRHDPAQVLETVSQLTQAIGSEKGVIAGQAVDLETQGTRFSESDLHFIHSCKTGALIQSSISCAAILSDTKKSTLDQLARFGMKIGLAFQIVDDILDIEGDSSLMGKTTGKDQIEQKATFPALFGIDESRKRAETLIREAEAEIEFLGSQGKILKGLARYVSVRRY